MSYAPLPLGAHAPQAWPNCTVDQYMVWEGVKVECGPEGCTFFDAGGDTVKDPDQSHCVEKCPVGYVPALRFNTSFPSGLRVCLTPSALADIKRQQPDSIRELNDGPSTLAVAAGVVGFGAIVWWLMRRNR